MDDYLLIVQSEREVHECTLEVNFISLSIEQEVHEPTLEVNFISLSTCIFTKVIDFSTLHHC